MYVLPGEPGPEVGLDRRLARLVEVGGVRGLQGAEQRVARGVVATVCMCEEKECVENVVSFARKCLTLIQTSLPVRTSKCLPGPGINTSRKQKEKARPSVRANEEKATHTFVAT